MKRKSTEKGNKEPWYVFSTSNLLVTELRADYDNEFCSLADLTKAVNDIFNTSLACDGAGQEPILVWVIQGNTCTRFELEKPSEVNWIKL